MGGAMVCQSVQPQPVWLNIGQSAGHAVAWWWILWWW